MPDTERRKNAPPTMFWMDQPTPPIPRGPFIAPPPLCLSPPSSVSLCIPFNFLFCSCLSVCFHVLFNPTQCFHTSLMCHFSSSDCIFSSHVWTAVDRDQVTGGMGTLCWHTCVCVCVRMCLYMSKCRPGVSLCVCVQRWGLGWCRIRFPYLL